MSVERPSGGSSQCPHSNLHIDLNNTCFGNTNIHYLEVRATCKICDRKMVFRGLPLGLSTDRPTSSIDGTEIIIPFLADGEDLTGSPIGYRVIAR